MSPIPADSRQVLRDLQGRRISGRTVTEKDMEEWYQDVMRAALELDAAPLAPGEVKEAPAKTGAVRRLRQGAADYLQGLGHEVLFGGPSV